MSSRISQVEKRFRRIARSLKPFELQLIEEEPALDERELFGELFGRATATRFLGYYSHAGILRTLEAYGIFEALHKKGFDNPQLELDLSDAFVHNLRIYTGRGRGRDSLLVDFSAHLGHGTEPEISPEPTELLVIDWLLMQNPKAKTTESLLPGQEYPRLGLGTEIAVMIGLIADRLKLDGCLATPAWYHNAVLYHGRYTFVEATVEGRYRALSRDTSHLSMAETSWALELDCVSCVETKKGEKLPGTRESVRWKGRPQLHACAPELLTHFRSPAFRGARDATLKAVAYEVDEEKLRQALLSDDGRRAPADRRPQE